MALFLLLLLLLERWECEEEWEGPSARPFRREKLAVRGLLEEVDASPGPGPGLDLVKWEKEKELADPVAETEGPGPPPPWPWVRSKDELVGIVLRLGRNSIGWSCLAFGNSNS